jgi:hypothetical protein
MPRCDHANAPFLIVIERWCDAYIQTGEIYDKVHVIRDAPMIIKVQVYCPDCEFSSRYNAYSDEYCHLKNILGRASARRWPTWLLNRLIPLRSQNAVVQEACLACGVPPAKHANWD